MSTDSAQLCLTTHEKCCTTMRYMTMIRLGFGQFVTERAFPVSAESGNLAVIFVRTRMFCNFGRNMLNPPNIQHFRPKVPKITEFVTELYRFGNLKPP